MERESTQKRFAVVEKLTDQVLKCRNAVRKKDYRRQLENAHKVLCSLATDSEEYKAKYFAEKKKYAEMAAKKAEWGDDAVALRNKLLEMDRIASNCEQQKQLRLNAEEDCGKLLDEKREALRKIDKAVKKNKRLQKELDSALAKIASLQSAAAPSAGD